MILLRVTLAILFSITVSQVVGQASELFEPYESTDYPQEKYEVTRDTVSFLNFKIEIIQLHLNSDNPDNSPGDFYCRGWLSVTEGAKVISQLYFPSLEPVGGCYGLFIPESQPRKDCFLLSCFHDYDAIIYLVDKQGKISNMYGGTFYVSNDNKLLFSHDGSDHSSLTVYNLDKKVELFSDTISPYLADWYFINGKFIATIWNQETNKVETSQFAYFDTRKKELKILSNQKFDILESKMLRSFNSKLPLNRCNCGK